MSNSPLFSIITICFNAEATIERTLKSVGAQNVENFEYIIIDGQSTDQTLSIIAKYKNHITTLVSEPDKGLYDAMNKGIDQAKGKYLCFLNAGDKFHESSTLQQLTNRVLSLPKSPDVIYGETAIVDNEGKFLRMRRLRTPKRLHWKSFKKGMLVCHQAFMPKRELTPHYNLKYKFSSDFDWCIQILKNANNTFNSQLTLIDYLSEGLTTTNHNKSLKERYRIMSSHYGSISTFLHHIGFAFRAIIKK